MTSIGLRLKSERTRLKISQQALANYGGVQSNAQGNYENNFRSPRADYLARLSQVGVDIGYVVTGQRSAEPLQPASAVPVENLQQIVGAVHESLHGMTHNLYQLTRLLENWQAGEAPLQAQQAETVRSEAEAICLAAVRLIYLTAALN